jgi:ATP synthase protein I
MAERDKTGPQASQGRQTPSDADLAAKLEKLDARLSDIRSERHVNDQPRGRLQADGTAMARGMKMVSEFVAGIAAGGLLGWIIDRLAGTQPIVLLIGLLFGFAAGLRNLYRATQARPAP